MFSIAFFYDFGNLLLLITSFSTYEESPYVCCIGVFNNDVAYVGHSLVVKIGGGQVYNMAWFRQPSRQQGFPERVDVGFTRFNYRQT